MLGHGGLGTPNLAALSGADAGGLFPALFASQSVIYVPIMLELPNVPLFPFLHFNQNNIRAVSITFFGDIIPETFESQNVIFTHLVTFEIVVGGMFTDPDLFFAPTLTMVANQDISPVLVVADPDFFFDPVVDTVDKFVTPFHFNDADVFWGPTVDPGEPPIIYDFPIGHSLYADYAIRNSMTFYKKRVVKVLGPV